MAKITLLPADAPPRDITLDKPRTSIGRKSSNDIHLDDPAVSGEHAVILRLAQEAVVEDLESTNGTRVNGQPVKKHFLQDGDVIQVAMHRLVYHATSTTEARFATGIPILEVARGKNAGLRTPLHKAITVIEGPDDLKLIILKSGADYILNVQAPAGRVEVNGHSVDAKGRRLRHRDVIRAAEAELHFLHVDASEAST